MSDQDILKIYPMMSLRDIVVFPHMVAPLVVGRDKSIKSLEKAMEERTEIFLTTQKDPSEDEPTEEGILYPGDHRQSTPAPSSAGWYYQSPGGREKARSSFQIHL